MIKLYFALPSYGTHIYIYLYIYIYIYILINRYSENMTNDNLNYIAEKLHGSNNDMLLQYCTDRYE